MDFERFQTYFFFGILIASFVLAFFVFRPYLYALVFAVTLSVIFYPFFEKIEKVLKGRKGIAAFLAVIFIFFIVAIPLGVAGIQIFTESKSFYENISQNKTNEFLNFNFGSVSRFSEKLKNFAPEISVSLKNYASDFVVKVFENALPIFSGISKVIANFFIALLALFFLFRDREKIMNMIFAHSPIADEYEKEIFSKLKITIHSVIKGTLLIALLQGVFAGIGFLIFGVPNPALLGLATVFAALIPVIGTLIVTLPAALYMFFSGSVFSAVGVFLWGVLIVSMIDNLLRPKIISKGVDIHPFLIFLSVLGGIQFFGPMGFLIGPLLISLVFSLIKIYPSFVLKK